MTLRTFFKNLFAPDSETKRLYTPLDLRLLEHYETWQKDREEIQRASKREAEKKQRYYEELGKEIDRKEAKVEAERRLFDQIITQSTCLRAATVEDYNEWLTDWLHAGESITDYSDNPFSGWKLHYVQDPDTWVSTQCTCYGTPFPKDSRYLFIIPKQYDCTPYLSAFCVENNAVYGWSNNEPGFYSSDPQYNQRNLHVPAFSDTVDQQMRQRAQAALEHCAEGERPEVDALDLRVFQEKDAYMRQQREFQARGMAQRAFNDLERAQRIAAYKEEERLEEQTLSKTDRVRPATCADYDRWLEAWVRAGNEISFYSDDDFNKPCPSFYYVIDPDAEFHIGDRSMCYFIIPKEYDCEDYLYKFCVSPLTVVYGWADNKPVRARDQLFGSSDPVVGYADTVDARLRKQARLKYRQEQ
ncbi:hypothetical protein [Rothia mucilaginosa]|uniref:hypothetical protein n=1 Tax=Rothia mucilaginosa TaxID=43675 RepID=UPI0028D75AE6|nr:hypothetical protein [Rothia mucilaginosa]